MKKSKSKISIHSRKIANVTTKTKINEIIEKNPDAVSVLFKAGLSCVGCPMTMQETLEEGCLAHGMNKRDINKLIERLNRK